MASGRSAASWCGDTPVHQQHGSSQTTALPQVLGLHLSPQNTTPCVLCSHTHFLTSLHPYTLLHATPLHRYSRQPVHLFLTTWQTKTPPRDNPSPRRPRPACLPDRTAAWRYRRPPGVRVYSSRFGKESSSYRIPNKDS